MASYRVNYERDERGLWVATVRGVPGCHTQGRTLRQARDRIREALGLFVPHANRAELVDHVRLPAEVRLALNRARNARAHADAAEKRAALETRAALTRLTHNLRLGRRDAAELVGLSHQRVQQLVRG